ncbi:ATP-grasp domain-containing protein [Halorarius litoreus]|uniref:carboxylate--amine ligase n=1 Tax=Halorarius litoreus TaxID=2962676 RepID=UPI0020CE0143|nr:ATP-grasp domain-containing protein [Halorarius litoreus]
MTAIVFNAAYNGLGIVRELGRNGVDVYVLDSFRNVGTVSRYGSYRHCPNPETDEAGFVERLLELGPTFDERPVVFPTNDHWAAAAARHKDRLSAFYELCVSDYEAVSLMLDKRRFGAWAVERGYPSPRTWAASEADRIPRESFPVAAKPNDARLRPDMMFRSRAATLSTKLTGGGGVDTETAKELHERAEAIDGNRLQVLDSPAEVDAFLATVDSEAYVLQEYVRGLSDQMVTVGVYADRDHEVRGLFVGRKRRGFPPDVGDCKLGESSDVPDELKDSVRELARDIELVGIAEFEFKQDSVSGEYRLIEINPRSWSWVGITPAAGVNLPMLAYRDLRDEPIPPYTENLVAPGEVKWVKLTEDLPNVLYYNREAGHPEWSGSLRDWWDSVRAKTLVTAEFSRDDPLPGVYALALAAIRVAGTIL